MRHESVNVLSAVDTASANGSQIDSGQLVSASFFIYFGDATATGTFKLQASNDIPTTAVNNFVVTNWVDIPTQTVAIATGGSQILTVQVMCYRWIRAVYTRSSGGTTTVNVNMNALSV